MDNTQKQRKIRGCKRRKPLVNEIRDCKRRKPLVNDSDDVSEAQKNQPNYFDTLPDEIDLEILKKLPQSQLDSLGLVCRRFNRIIEDRTLWKEVVCGECKLQRDDVGKWMRRQVQHLFLHKVTILSPLLLPSLEATQPSWSLKEVCLREVRTHPDDLVLMFNECKQLRNVTLARIFVNNDLLVALSENKNIEILHLLRVRGLEPVGLEILLKNLRKLQNFYIDSYSSETTSLDWPGILSSMCENLSPSLLQLTLQCRGYLITDSHVAAIVENCPLLQNLDLSHCYARALTARSMESLQNLKDLHILKLQMCKGIPPAVFLPLTKMENLVRVAIEDYYFRSNEQRTHIEELLRVTVIQVDPYMRVGTFKTSSGVVKITY